MEARRRPRLTHSRRRAAVAACAAAVLAGLLPASLAAITTAYGGGTEVGEGRMRIEMRTEGGVAFFPGLAKPAVIELSALPAAEGESLRALVAAALAAPPAAPPPAGAADYRTTHLAIDDDGVRRELTITDLDDEPALRALLDALRRLKRAPTPR